MASCPIKDDNYHRILKALNYNEAKVYQIYLAFNENLPDYDYLVDKGIIPEEHSNTSVLTNAYKYVINKYHKAINIKSKQVSIARREGNTELEKKLSIEIEKLKNKVHIYSKKLKDIKALETQELKNDGKRRDLVIKALFDSFASEVDFILSSDDVDPYQINIASRMLDAWVSATTFSDEHNLFDKEEEEEIVRSPERLAVYSYINTKSRLLKAKVSEMIKGIIKQEMSQTLSEEAVSQIDKELSDISSASSVLLSVNQYGNALTSLLWSLGKKTEYSSNKEIMSVFKKIDELLELLKPYDKQRLKELFLQKSSNGTQIPRLVHRYSHEWFRFYSRIMGTLKSHLTNNNVAKFNISVQVLKRNAIIINPLELFDEAGNEIQSKNAYSIRNKLKKNLSSESYLRIMESIKSKAKNYYISRNTQMELYSSSPEGSNALAYWELNNSPSSVVSLLTNGINESTIKDITDINTSFIEIVPVSGKNFYDSNFSVIENDPVLREVYYNLTALLSKLRVYLPPHVKSNININSLPMVTKSLIRDMIDNGLGKFMPKVWEKLLDNITIPNEGDVVSSRNIDSNGNIIPELTLKGVKFYETAVEQFVEDKVKAFTMSSEYLETPEDMRGKKISEVKRLAYEEAYKKLSSEMDFDLENILKVYSAAVITYEHKTEVEDIMSIISTYINNASEQLKTPSGKVVTDPKGRPVMKTEGLEHLREAVDYYIRVFFGHPKANIQMVTSKKVLSEEERELKESIEKNLDSLEKKFKEKSISETDYLLTKFSYMDQLNSLGRNISVANIIDVLNNYIRLKGLGWNPIAPITNINVAFFANMMEASRSKHFDTKSLLRAYSLLFSQGTKIGNIFRNLHILKTITSEIYESSSPLKTKKLDPFYLTEKAEYFNQAPVLVAILNFVRVKVDGVEKSLYDLYNDEGELTVDISKVEFLNSKFNIFKNGEHMVKAYIEQVRDNIHGNYDANSPILADANVVYRSLLVFRRWIINSFWNRVRPEEYDPVFNDIEKGRWRSYSAFYKEYGLLGGTLNIATSTLKGVLFLNNDFSKLNELDAGNMRANIRELVFLAYIVAIAALLYGMMGDDEEEKPSIGIYSAIFISNILGRLTRDITLYADPEQFKSMLRDPIPIWGLVNDVRDVIVYSIDYMSSNEEDYTEYRWEQKRDKTFRAYNRLLPYGFSVFSKIETYATKKDLY